MSCKKILFVLKVPPPIHGSTIMNQHVFHSKLIRSHFQAEFCPQSISNARTIGKVSIRKIFAVLIDYFRLVRSLVRSKPDLIYFALSPIGFAFIKDAIAVFMIKLFSKKPIVFHLHGKGIRSQSEKSRIFRKIYRAVFSSSYLIHLSRLLFEDVSEFEFKKKFAVANGIEKGHYGSATVEKQTVTYLSNLIREKGIEEFIEVCSLLKKENVRFKICVIGKEMDISYKFLEDRLKELNLFENIRHLGAAYGKEKDKLLEETAVLIFPTYYRNECYPLVILEAQQLGIPVITSYEGAIPDIIENGVNGFTLYPSDIERMANETKRLLEDKFHYLRMSTRAKELFWQRNTLEKFESNLVNVLESVLLDYSSDQ